MYSKIIEDNGQEIALDDVLGLFTTESRYTNYPLAINDIQDIANPQTILAIRTTVLDFAQENNTDYLQHGLRFVVEPHEWPARLSITQKPVAAQNFSDWLKPKVQWQSGLETGQGGFFEKCTLAALQANPPQINDAPIAFLTPQDKSVFAVKDGSPKSPGHYLILTTAPRANMLDTNFTKDEWLKSFQLAYKLFAEKAKPGQQLRIIANIGQDYQRGPHFNLHVQWDDEFMSFDPEDYGFTVDQDHYYVLEDANNDLYAQLKKSILHYEQAQNDTDKIKHYNHLKEFLNSRVQFR